MTQPLRLVHASDLHLEMPVHGLPEVPDHLRELLIEAPYHAAEQVFESARMEALEAAGWSRAHRSKGRVRGKSELHRAG